MLNQLTSLARDRQVRGARPRPNHRLLCPLAEQHTALHVAARTVRRPRRSRPPHRVLRVLRVVPRVPRVLRERTGWTLVAFGLRLLDRPARDGRSLAESAR